VVQEEGPGTGLVVSRTYDRAGEVLNLILGLLPFAVAAGLVVAVLWRPSGVRYAVLAFAALLVLLGLSNLRRNVLAPATQLSFDPASGTLSWKNIVRQGSVEATAIARVERYAKRPKQYMIVPVDGAGRPVPFWLSTKHRPEVRHLTEVLARSNPSIELGQLYERRQWWPGLQGGAGAGAAHRVVRGHGPPRHGRRGGRAPRPRRGKTGG
jgi:hypothetical protein